MPPRKPPAIYSDLELFETRGRKPDKRLAAVIAEAKAHLANAKTEEVLHARNAAILKFVDKYYGFNVRERFEDDTEYEEKLSYFGWLLDQ